MSGLHGVPGAAVLALAGEGSPCAGGNASGEEAPGTRLGGMGGGPCPSSPVRLAQPLAAPSACPHML